MTTEHRNETSTSLRNRLVCVSEDPCNYDHTCTNHRILADLERELAALRQVPKELRELSEKATQGYLEIIDGETYNFAVKAIVGVGKEPVAEFFDRKDAELFTALVNRFRSLPEPNAAAQAARDDEPGRDASRRRG